MHGNLQHNDINKQNSTFSQVGARREGATPEAAARPKLDKADFSEN